MRRCTAAALTALFFCAAGAAYGQSSYVITDAIRLPAESYVGDPVELRYTVRSEASPTIPEEIPQPRWGAISSLRIEQGSGQFDLRLTVVPYEAGTLTLPRLDLGRLRLDGLNLLVTSILPEGDESLRPAHGPQRLPGTRAALLLGAFLISLLLALLLYGLGPGRKHIRTLVARYRARLPYRRLLSRLHTLEREIAEYSVREFYITLVSDLQLFMSGHLDRDCRAATSTELVAMLVDLERACGAPPGTATALEDIFAAADEAKFAHQTVRKRKRVGHLEVVESVVTRLESYRRRIRTASSRRSRVAEEHAHVGA